MSSYLTGSFLSYSVPHFHDLQAQQNCSHNQKRVTATNKVQGLQNLLSRRLWPLKETAVLAKDLVRGVACKLVKA